MRRIGLIGLGAIARTAMESVRHSSGDLQIAAVLVRNPARCTARLPDGCRLVADVEELIALSPDGIFECASHTAVREYGPAILSAGRDFWVISVGAFADQKLLAALTSAAEEAKSRLVLLSGALAGIEALAAANIGGLDQVVHTVIKPPSAWRNTPAEDVLDLDNVQSSVSFFEGFASDAARDYPANANSTAAVALAGLGLQRTRTVLVADPNAGGNVHVLEASGQFGNMKVELQGHPLDDNPKTSKLAALSVARAMLGTLHGRVI